MTRACMLGAWLALAGAWLAACYRPSLSHERCVACGPQGQCPGDQPCVAGFCGGVCTAIDAPPVIEDGATIDAEPDGGIPTTCIPSPIGMNGQNTLELLAPDQQGPSYTVDQQRSAAMFRDRTSSIGTGAPDSGTLEVAIRWQTDERYFAPHLSPEGNEVYVQRQIPSTNSFRFAVATKLLDNEWSIPQPISVRTVQGVEMAIGITDFPGTPTAQGAGGVPRRMMILKDNVFYELVEDGASWRAKTLTYNAAYFTMTDLSHPQLSPDGLWMVFTATRSAETAVYATMRSEVDDIFPRQAVRIYGPVDSKAHAFLTSDCARLYVQDPLVGIVAVF